MEIITSTKINLNPFIEILALGPIELARKDFYN
jgi:hypothetical protein